MLPRYFLLDSSSEEEEISERLQRKILRDGSNPFDLTDKSFMQRFRLNKEAFKYVVENTSLATGIRSTYIPKILRIGMTLEILGGGSYQWQTGNDYIAPAAQSTVSTIFQQVTNAMEINLCSKWIKFPGSLQDTKQHFYEKYKIPGVIGVIDGTHLSLLKPSKDEHIYFNRKGRHSINAMIICDHKKRITAICPKYGGAAHDSFVWSNSSERKFLERNFNRGENNSWLLGDSGYALEPWLMTPYCGVNESESLKIQFNNVHSKARSVIERCIGIYKGRWRMLLDERKTRYSPEKFAKCANICAALHNICVHFKVHLAKECRAPDDVTVPEFSSNVPSNNRLTNCVKNIRNKISCML